MMKTAELMLMWKGLEKEVRRHAGNLNEMAEYIKTMQIYDSFLGSFLSSSLPFKS